MVNAVLHCGCVAILYPYWLIKYIASDLKHMFTLSRYLVLDYDLLKLDSQVHTSNTVTLKNIVINNK